MHASLQLRPTLRHLLLPGGWLIGLPAHSAAKRQRVCRWLMLGAMMLAAGLGLDAVWIHAKAALAQLLLARAGARSNHVRDARRLRPWADMAPMARLSVARLLQNLIVPDDGRYQTLTSGPGWIRGSAVPGTHVSSVIRTHRDTRFRFSRMLWPGIPAASSRNDPLLLTRHPFNEILPRGPLRHLVHARRTNLNTISGGSSPPAGTNARALGQT